ncbi:MAG: carbon storage regulator CsrA [Actinobacteria bacterium]|nr:carbon storage regulator CsrA [Actinomycetota bacterium]
MLVLTRKAGETIAIGKDIRISIVEIDGRSVRVGIEAPKSVTIYRGEIYEKVQEQNRQAARQGLNTDIKFLAGKLAKNVSGFAENPPFTQNDNKEERFDEQ